MPLVSAKPRGRLRKLEHAAVFHFRDSQVAMGRAREIGGCVIWSWGPNGPRDDWGFWSDPDPHPLLRNGERIVWPKGR